jgi:AcrR family transcriptional regulator
VTPLPADANAATSGLAAPADLVAAPATTTRPGGRSARVRAAVHRATEELLAEGGPQAATIPAVALRAGVHATTVYRRWGTAAELHAAVALGRLTGELVVPDTGSLRGDLTQWVHDVLTDLADPDVLLMLRTVLGTTPDAAARCACVADRHAQLEAMLDEERARGHAPPDAERLLEMLLGPVYFRALFDEAPLPAEHVDALVEQALALVAHPV